MGKNYNYGTLYYEAFFAATFHQTFLYILDNKVHYTDLFVMSR